MRRHITSIAQAKCSWKRRFESERIAKIRAAEAEPQAGCRLHVYRCPVCKGWHLTKNGQGRHVRSSEVKA